MSRFVSLLDGPFARDWEPYLRDCHVAFVPSAPIAARPTEAKHFCPCGIEQTYCTPCGLWVCRAPGHLQHLCGGTT